MGSVRKAHGIQGEVKAYLDVDDITDYHEKESVYLLIEGKLTPFFIDSFRAVSDNLAILKFRDIDTRGAAENIYATEMYLPLSELPTLAEGKFFYHEIIGFSISDTQLGELGEVIRVDEMPAQDLVVMSYQKKEVLIPMTERFVLRADKANKVLFTALPEGLLEIYLGTDKPA